MTIYTVGVKLRARTKAVTIEAEDALLAALKIKLENPEALLTYVRKSNRRGDRRHPHESLSEPSAFSFAKDFEPLTPRPLQGAGLGAAPTF